MLDIQAVRHLPTRAAYVVWSQAMRGVLRAAKLGVEPLKPLKLKLRTLDIELQDLVFALLGFGLALVQYFHTIL